MEELDRDDPGIPEPQVIIIRDAKPLVAPTKDFSDSESFSGLISDLWFIIQVKLNQLNSGWAKFKNN